jgi:hypothetical protein
LTPPFSSIDLISRLGLVVQFLHDRRDREAVFVVGWCEVP